MFIEIAIMCAFVYLKPDYNALIDLIREAHSALRYKWLELLVHSKNTYALIFWLLMGLMLYTIIITLKMATVNPLFA